MRAVVVLAALSAACRPSAGPPSVPRAGVQPPAPISAAELRADVELLASDELAGRGTLEEGEARAAALLSRRFADLGLSPLPDASGYQRPFALRQEGHASEATRGSLSGPWGEVPLVAGSDFKTLFSSRDARAEGQLVFGGYGISRPDLGHDDYDGLDVRGKIVVVLRHAPRRGEDDERFDSTDDATFVRKGDVARKRGAIALIVVNDPRSAVEGGGAEDFRMDGRLRLSPRWDGTRIADLGRFVERFIPVDRERDRFVGVLAGSKVSELVARGLEMPMTQVQAALDRGQPARELRFAAPMSASLSVGLVREPRPVAATNVVGMVVGRERPEEWVVVGAHYDHLGTFAGNGDTIYNGADDNASGTAALLAVARTIAAGPRPMRSVVFVGFSAEEKGLLGSSAFVVDPQVRERVVFMLNMDMLGRNEDSPVQVDGDAFALGMTALVEEESRDLDLKLELGNESMSRNSDHYPFFAAGVPVLNLFTGLHDDYHQVSDHPEKLDYSRMARIATLARRMVSRVAEMPSVPAYLARPAWLGAALTAVKEGARIVEVEARSPAERSGLRVGDRVVAIGSGEIRGVPVGELFDSVEAGRSFAVTVERSGRQRRVALTRPPPGQLGVWTEEPSAELIARLGLVGGTGVVIRRLADDGPAKAAGLRAGDVIVDLEGWPVSTRNLSTRLARLGAGTPVRVVVRRQGEVVVKTVVLAGRPRR